MFTYHPITLYVIKGYLEALALTATTVPNRHKSQACAVGSTELQSFFHWSRSR